MRALLARLEATDEEYREAQEQVRRGFIVILVVGLSHVLIGILLLMLHGIAADSADGATLGFLVFSETVIVGAVLVGCFFLSRRAPVVGIGVALAFWLGFQMLKIAISPSSLLTSFLSATGVATLFAKVVVLTLLARALYAGLAARTMLARRRMTKS